MRIIVNDSSALIDLRKGGLLEALLKLPFEFVVADTILADELLRFTPSEISLMRRHMLVESISDTLLKDVVALQSQHPALSLYDCMSYVIAKGELGCILLTGDRRLRSAAEAAKIECRGVLWVVNELADKDLATPRLLLKALEIWRDDITVRLPKAELNAAIARFRS